MMSGTISRRRGGWVTGAMILCLGGGLINSRHFINPSLTAYFLYTAAAAVLVAIAGGKLIIKKQKVELNLPVLLFGAWAVYVLISAVASGQRLNTWQTYLIISCLLFIAAMLYFRLYTGVLDQLGKAIVCLAGLESLLCLLQYADIVAGSNPFFHVTGSWTNPNVTAMFLAMALPAALIQLWDKGLFRWIACCVLVLSGIALFLLLCRTALAGALAAAVVILNARYGIMKWFVNGRRMAGKIILILGIAASGWLVMYYSYKAKQASADGRILIWRISAGLLADKPFGGYGYGLFEREYNLAQAKYFEQGKGTGMEKAHAGYVHMAYNEVIQQMVEGGLLGLLFPVCILLCLLIPPLADNDRFTGMSGAAYAGIIAFALMSLVNFTVQAVPVMCLFVLYAAMYTVTPGVLSCWRGIVFRVRSLSGVWLLAAGICAGVIQGIWGIGQWENKQAAVAIEEADYDRASELLSSLSGILSNSELYLRNYGKLLYRQKKYAEAALLFGKAETFSSDPDIYLYAGNCNANAGHYASAVSAFRTAENIQPYALRPKYMLMKLYQKTGDRENQLEQARDIGSIDTGHPSAETDAYKQEAKAVVERLSGKSTPDMRVNQAVLTAERGNSIAIKKSASVSGPAADILEEAGKNRAELEKAITYFSKKGDAMQLKALYFLLANMGIHYSSDYYWSNGHAVPYVYRDIDSIKTDLLIGNIEAAFEAWRNPWSRHVSFDEFCEYILPYRVSIEPLEKWRPLYVQRFGWMKDSIRRQTRTELLKSLAHDIKRWFTNTYDIEVRKEPLPRLGALQLLDRKKGPCEDIADLACLALRSQGIPATNDMVVYWATSTGSHFFNSTPGDSSRYIRFDVSTGRVRFEKFDREPAKVIRSTYSRQPDCLANTEDPANIPYGFMRTVNYKDVTGEFWPTRDVHCPLFEKEARPGVAYCCVFNGFGWRPAWWGRPGKDSVVFNNMCQGAAFLPAYYLQGKIVPAGNIVLSGYGQTTILDPDTTNTHQVVVEEDDRYLHYRPGKKYRLYYWNKAWRELGVRRAAAKARSLTFDKVPRHALLLLVPEYTQHKERPFFIAEDGKRTWW